MENEIESSATISEQENQDAIVENDWTDLEGEEHEQEIRDLKQFCVFRIGSEEYALPIEVIKEVVKFKEPAPIPQMPSYIVGMTNIRGNIFGILDLEKFFSVGSDSDHRYLLVLDHADFSMAIGIPDVPDSILIDEDNIEDLKTSTKNSSLGQQYLKGVIKTDDRMIILFDVVAIISNENFTSIS